MCVPAAITGLNITLNQTDTDPAINIEQEKQAYQECCEGTHQGPRENKNRVSFSPDGQGRPEGAVVRTSRGRESQAMGTAGAKALRYSNVWPRKVRVAGS